MSLSNNFPAIRPSLLLDFANTTSLDPRITFTRASTATYYDGVTVAKAEENLLLESQDFTTTWANGDTTDTANTSVAPDGTTTADTITDSATTTGHDVSQSLTSTANATYVYSCFLKNGTRQFAILAVSTGPNVWASAKFDLSAGTAGSTGSAGGGVFSSISSTITSVGNGWYRCTLTFTITTATTISMRVGLATDGTTFTAGLRGLESYLGNGSTILAWGAQLEQRSSVTAYTATTTQPIINYIPVLLTAASGVARFEHNPVTGESLGLEIEEQRTNLLLRSEEFDNASWTKAGATITANTVVSPDGTLTSDAIVESTASAQRAVFQAQTLTAAAHTFSVYAKRGIGSQRWLTLFPQGTGVSANTIFDINAGTVVASAGAQHLSSSITNVGNGWYRCSISFTAAAVSITNVIYLTNNTASAAPTYTGDGYSGIYIWGAQLEAGSFATSYIPTVASQVTRSADSASMTGTNFSSWYRADEGTVYTESLTLTAGTDKYQCEIGDGTASNRFSIASQASNQDNYVIVNGSVQANANFAVSRATTIKNALGYKLNDVRSGVNGSLGAADTSVSVPIVNTLYIGSARSNLAMLNGTLAKLAYYPKRLQNSELQALTTI